jgi:hypothetical protein
MRKIIKDLKKGYSHYVPISNDPTDCALANFINAKKDPLDIQFTRTDKGVYLFGSKRVFIKVENGMIIIRVGGGYMQIEEFMKIYTPLEYEKQEATIQDGGLLHVHALGLVAKGITEEYTGKPSDLSPRKVKKTLLKTI